MHLTPVGKGMWEWMHCPYHNGGRSSSLPKYFFVSIRRNLKIIWFLYLLFRSFVWFSLNNLLQFKSNQEYFKMKMEEVIKSPTYQSDFIYCLAWVNRLDTYGKSADTSSRRQEASNTRGYDAWSSTCIALIWHECASNQRWLYRTNAHLNI